MTALRWLTFACSLSGLIGCGDRGEAVTPTDAAAAKQPAQTARIRGHLLGSDGQPVAHAEVHVNEIGRPEYSVRVKDDGEFAIGLPDAGWVRLRLTGVDHADHTIGLLAEPGEHELTVRLGTYPRPAKFESVAGFGQFHGAGPTEAPAGQQRVNLVFHPRDDGKWVAKLARGDAGAGAQTFHYQIRDATSVAHTINGTQSDHYVYDGGGDYFSVLELGETDPIEIVWDPASLPPAGRELELRFVDPDTLVARSAQLGETIAKQRNEIMRSAAKRVDADTDTETRELELVRARAQVRERFADKAAAESTPALAGMWWIGWLEMLEFEPSDADRAAYQAQAKQVLELLGPRNPVWSMNEGWAMATALRYVDDPQFFSLAVAEHPDPTVGAALWLSTLMAADESGDLESGREATRALADPRFAELDMVGIAGMYSPDRPTAPGRKVPDFHVRSADGSTEYSAESLLGRTYVLDFWATWCGPCVAEMPRLHAAYAELNGAAKTPALELISISFDGDLRAVEQFRERWPMPWAHAVPDGPTHKQLTESFGIFGIPTMVLVGPDGVILASSPRLDGGSLGEIAARAI